jgi:fructose-specific phosphotransferase system IIA component
MRLSNILLKNHISLPLPAKDRDSAIRELLTLLEKDKLLANFDEAFQAVLNREKIMTTGVGNGIAIPHCKHSSCPNFAVAMGVHNKGIDFSSIDKKNVNIIFLLVGPENNPGLHIKLLSRISRLMSSDDLRDQVLEIQSAEELLALLRDEEDYLFDLD